MMFDKVELRVLADKIAARRYDLALDMMCPISWTMMRSQHTGVYYVAGYGTKGGERLDATAPTLEKAMANFYVSWYAWVSQ